MISPRILVPSVGRKVALVRLLGERFDVFVADSDEDAAGMLAVKEGQRVDSGREDMKSWLPGACKAHGIKVVLPVRNEDAASLGALAKSLKRGGVQAIVSPAKSVEVCLDKLVMAETFPGLVPRTTLEPEKFPCFAKPRRGAGSQGCGVVNSLAEYVTITNSKAEMVYQPIYGGTEVTVDLFLDRRHKLVQRVYRQRFTVRGGQMDYGRAVGEEEAKETSDYLLGRVVKKVLSALRFTGPINMQFLGSGGKFWLLDINPRFSGGYPLSHSAGADFPRMLWQMATGRKITATKLSKTAVLASSYTDYVYREEG